MLLAGCATNDIVNHVLPFVTESISNTDWRFRDAAVMAFGKQSIDVQIVNAQLQQTLPLGYSDEFWVVKNS